MFPQRWAAILARHIAVGESSRQAATLPIVNFYENTTRGIFFEITRLASRAK